MNKTGKSGVLIVIRFRERTFVTDTGQITFQTKVHVVFWLNSV